MTSHLVQSASHRERWWVELDAGFACNCQTCSAASDPISEESNVVHLCTFAMSDSFNAPLQDGGRSRDVSRLADMILSASDRCHGDMRAADLPNELCPVFRSVLEREAAKPVSLGCHRLDKYLNGGLPAGCCALVELAGPGGSGKTQLALQVAVSACEGNDAGAVYAVCKGRFASGRCRELAAARVTSCIASRDDKVNFKKSVDEILDKIVVEEISSAEALLTWALWRLPYLLRESGARVVIIDSVAALYRPEFDNALARAGHLCRMAAALKSALRETRHGDGVCLCINQVSQKFGRSFGGGSVTAPALGPAWSVCLNTRLFIDRSPNGSPRLLRVLHAGHLSSAKPPIGIVIDKSGVWAEEPPVVRSTD